MYVISEKDAALSLSVYWFAVKPAGVDTLTVQESGRHWTATQFLGLAGSIVLSLTNLKFLI